MDMMRRKAGWYVIPLLGAVWGCQSTPPSAPPKTQGTAVATQPAAEPAPPKVVTDGYPRIVDGRVVLATAPAGADGNRTYEVSIGSCTGEGCPVQVALLEDGKVLDQKSTEWSSATRQPVKEQLKAGWGVGDPTGPPPGVTAWSTGEEEKYLGTAVRAFWVAPGTAGLLIDQRTGFEHVKRRHELFVAANNRLLRPWAEGDGAGPASTSTAILDLGKGVQALVFFDGFRYPATDRPDTMIATVLEWEPSQLKMKPRKDVISMHAAVITGFATIDAARQFRSLQSSCLGWFWVLPASQFPESRQPGYVLALPTATLAVAEAKRAEASKCVSEKKLIVVSMR